MMDAEGLHVVEHVLLRPASHSSRRFNLACVDCEGVKADNDASAFYLADDPYSFTCTVIIPYWGRRFRNTDFREYFERTLRQEAPSHVLLHIVWITPEQMSSFERDWRGWLDTNAAGRESCQWENDLNALVETMESLQSAYPPLSRFGDNESTDRGDIIVLDKTILPA